MNIETVTSLARSEIHSLLLDVEEETSTCLAVRAGMFRCTREDYEFTEDQFYDLPGSAAVDIWITGYLAKETATGNVVLIVDEVLQDGVDIPLRFEKVPEYDLLFKMFWFRLPAGETELTNLDVAAMRLEDFPAEEEERDG